MHIEPPPVSLFLFPHQDDEFGVFFQIEREQAAGRSVYCVYVTDGSNTADPHRRNAESRAVLEKLGVPADNIIFLGSKLQISDGQLHTQVKKFLRWFGSFFDAYPSVHACFIPAWEGGHPDHDMLHAATVKLLGWRNQLDIARQYPLYNGYDCRSPLFRALAPLSENGAVEQAKLSLRQRLRYLRFCLAYPSQWKSWIGLFPFVCWRYLIDGKQYLQRPSIDRITQPPHPGTLYYERRSLLDWEAMQDAVSRISENIGAERDESQTKL